MFPTSRLESLYDLSNTPSSKGFGRSGLHSTQLPSNNPQYYQTMTVWGFWKIWVLWGPGSSASVSCGSCATWVPGVSRLYLVHGFCHAIAHRSQTVDAVLMRAELKVLTRLRSGCIEEPSCPPSTLPSVRCLMDP